MSALSKLSSKGHRGVTKCYGSSNVHSSILSLLSFYNSMSPELFSTQCIVQKSSNHKAIIQARWCTRPLLHQTFTPVWMDAMPPHKSLHAPPLPSNIPPVVKPASAIIFANSG